MRASAAFIRGVGLLDPERECRIVDFPKEVSPAVEALLHKAYLDSLNLMPAAYGRMYRMSELRAARYGTSHRVSDAYERLHRISELLAAGYDVTGSEAPPVPRGPRKRSAALRTVERLVEETGAGALVAPHFYGAGVLGKLQAAKPRSLRRRRPDGLRATLHW